MAVRIGCSGWHYREWTGPFYPVGLPARQRFAYYAERFDTVELNTTFYRLPSRRAVDAWAAVAPPGFLYSLKLGAFGSHRKKLADPGSWLPRHLDRVLRLGDALAVNLVQLPPRWRCDVPRLDEFLACAAEAGTAAGRSLRWAVELRDASWVHDDVFAVLERHGAALALHDLLPQPWLRTAPFTYLRFHGPDAPTHPYHGAYGRHRLEPYAERLRPWVDEGCDVYAYFNNDVDAHATRDAVVLADLLRR